MTGPEIRTAGLIVVLLSCFSVQGAIEPPAARPIAKPTDQKTPPRREIPWLLHPAKNTPAEQLSHAFALYKEKRYWKAGRAYLGLVYAWPDSPQAPDAQLAYAQILEHQGNYLDAFDEYQYLIDQYPGQFDYGKVIDRQFQIANYLMTSPRTFLFFFSFKAPERALPLFEQISRNAPTWEKAAEVQFKIGLIHEETDEIEEAIAAYEILQNRHPSGDWAAMASFHEAQCLYRVFQDRPEDENSCNAARAALVQFITTYPGNPNNTVARTYLNALNTRMATLAFERARFYDESVHRPGSAIAAYESFMAKFPESPLASKARDRVVQLRKESAPK